MDIYEQVTAKIVEAIEAGVDRWKMPWHVRAEDGDAIPFNVASHKFYRGVNVLALWAAAQAHGYPSHAWATYRQWAEKGAQVRKGEKSTSIVFWKISDASADSESDEDEGRTRAFARGYSVFNVAQVDGYMQPTVESRPEPDRIAEAEAFFGALGIEIQNGGSRACYLPLHDRIQMPEFSAFAVREMYYSVLAHEATHATGHKSRLDRDLLGRFGKEAHAAEELVAELGAAFTCATLGLLTETRADHASYIAHWLKVLKSDKRAIFTAASKAQAAVDWMLARQQPAELAKAA